MRLPSLASPSGDGVALPTVIDEDAIDFFVLAVPLLAADPSSESTS
jgi:hypothetical protein